jgi:hypothetical protein
MGYKIKEKKEDVCYKVKIKSFAELKFHPYPASSQST